ncbi:hypothetical protein [Neptuniibacter sp. QD37_11]|uniref:hypothetical protein n=1 Tax=Neptuniibacter sp. QD37_11 TaxID=3398209 RepID=UPI0039F57CBB
MSNGNCQLFKSAENFFNCLNVNFDDTVSVIIVTHVLDNPQPYLDFLKRNFNLALVLAKSGSASSKTVGDKAVNYPILVKSREELSNQEVVVEIINSYCPIGRLVLVDTGGYFSELLADITDLLTCDLLGVIEVTENGLQRYEKKYQNNMPILTVARSPLKGPEDFWTGRSIVFSAEVLLREIHIIPNGQKAVVFGYGKLGQSICSSLQALNIHISVVELCPQRAIQAHCRGLKVEEKKAAISESTLVFCATGNKALMPEDYQHLKSGAFICTVTSADDEIFLPREVDGYLSEPVTKNIRKYGGNGKYFYIANNGNAINFIHNAEVGPYIFLVQAEIIQCIDQIARIGADCRIGELDKEFRNRIASIWLKHFE